MKSNNDLIHEVGISDFNEPIPESMIHHLINLTRADALTATDCIPDWEQQIISACKGGLDWVPRKFIAKLREHHDRYPAFKPERVAQMFIAAEPKTRQRYCYEEISTFTKSIHKLNSLRSLSDSQS